PQEVAVAFLASHISLTGEHTSVERRTQPLKIPTACRLVSVARIDTDPRNKPSLSPQQLEETAQAIADLSTAPRTDIVQIDFDATQSERPFYSSLIRRVRELVPP